MREARHVRRIREVHAIVVAQFHTLKVERVYFLKLRHVEERRERHFVFRAARDRSHGPDRSNRFQLEEGGGIVRKLCGIDIRVFDEPAFEPHIEHEADQVPAPHVVFGHVEQGASGELRRSGRRGVRLGSAGFQLKANERGTIAGRRALDCRKRTAVFFQPVGVEVPRQILVRIRPNRGQQCLAVRHAIRGKGERDARKPHKQVIVRVVRAKGGAIANSPRFSPGSPE